MRLLDWLVSIKKAKAFYHRIFGTHSMCLVFAVHAIRLISLSLSSLPHCIGKILQHLNSSIPVDTRVSNTNAFLQPTWSFRWYLLIAFIDMTLDHHTHNTFITISNLFSNRSSNLWLVPMVLLRIAVATIDHHDFSLTLLTKRFFGRCYGFDVEVCATRPASQDNKAIVVSCGTVNCCKTLRIDGKQKSHFS